MTKRSMLTAYEQGIEWESCSAALTERKKYTTQSAWWKACNRGDWLLFQWDHLPESLQQEYKLLMDKAIEAIIIRAIRRGLRVYKNPGYQEWGKNWISGIDRTEASAVKADRAARAEWAAKITRAENAKSAARAAKAEEIAWAEEIEWVEGASWTEEIMSAVKAVWAERAESAARAARAVWAENAARAARAARAVWAAKAAAWAANAVRAASYERAARAAWAASYERAARAEWAEQIAKAELQLQARDIHKYIPEWPGK